VSGTIGTAGNAAVVVTAAGIANSPITLSVPVSSGDSATTVASKVNAALAQNSDITDFFTISPDNGRYVRLTAKAAADNDPTMNISIANGTCTGLTAIPTSTVDAAGNVGTRQVETATVSGSISYNWTYNLYYQNLPTRDGPRPVLRLSTRSRPQTIFCASPTRFICSGGDAMTLTFEYTLDAGAGLSPQVIHTSDNLLHFIYLTSDGTVAGSTADPVLGLYDNLTYTETGRISPDESVSCPSIKKVAHYGAYGFWSAEGDHRFVMYMLPADITNSFIDGSVKFSIGSEVSQMSCTLLNIKGALLNRYRAFVTPGTKMELYFSLGSASFISTVLRYRIRMKRFRYLPEMQSESF